MMQSALKFLTPTRIGLILNLVGTLMVAASFGKNPEGAYQDLGKDSKVYLTSCLHPRLFIGGLILIMLGFLF